LVSTGVACAIVGVLFYRHSKPKQIPLFKPTTSVPTTKERIKEAFALALGIFEVILILPLVISSWEIVVVDGYVMITAIDLLLVGLLIVWTLVVSILIRYFRSKPEERRTFFFS